MEDIVLEGPRSKVILTWYFSIKNFKNAQLLLSDKTLPLVTVGKLNYSSFLFGSLKCINKEIEIVVYYLELERYLAG